MCCRDVLAHDPENHSALYMLGVVRAQQGNPAEAVELLDRAVAANPRSADAMGDLGVLLMALNRDNEALALFDQVLDLVPKDPATVFHRAMALRKLGRFAEAVASYDELLVARPNHVETVFARGLALLQLNRLEDATTAFRRVIDLNKDHLDGWFNYGNALRKLRRLDEALESYNRVLTLKADSFEGMFNKGLTLFLLKRYDEAAACFIERILVMRPGHPGACNNLGNISREMDRFDEALGWYDKALATAPNDADVLNNRGIALRELGRFVEALESYDRALAIVPAHVPALNNRGQVLRDLNRQEEALESWGRALELDPRHGQAAMNRGLALLAQGRFAEGWNDYRRRDSVDPSPQRLLQRPFATDLTGRRIYVMRDQGLGDEIFFLRFMRELKDRNAWLGYRTQPQIASIVRRLDFIDRVVEEGRDPDVRDASMAVFAGDLPYLLGVKGPDDLPATIALSAEPERIAAIRCRLGAAGPRPWIGVTWQAGLRQSRKLSKRAPEEDMGRVLGSSGGTLVVLQRLPCEGEIERFSAAAGRPAADFTAINNDLEDMLALLDLFDDYVCVSNTNVHLREALGRPSRVLVPWPADYRWMDAGDRSPWFPGSPVYRQEPDGNWSRAFAALARDLDGAGK